MNDRSKVLVIGFERNEQKELYDLLSESAGIECDIVGDQHEENWSDRLIDYDWCVFFVKSKPKKTRDSDIDRVLRHHTKLRGRILLISTQTDAELQDDLFSKGVEVGVTVQLISRPAGGPTSPYKIGVKRLIQSSQIGVVRVKWAWFDRVVGLITGLVVRLISQDARRASSAT